MDIDPIKQRAAYPLLVAGNHGRSTGAGLDWIPIIAARAGIYCGDQLKIGWKCQRALGAADGDAFIFDRLAHHFQNAQSEFRQFVQE